jgi:hypothetical protein
MEFFNDLDEQSHAQVRLAEEWRVAVLVKSTLATEPACSLYENLHSTQQTRQMEDLWGQSRSVDIVDCVIAHLIWIIWSGRLGAIWRFGFPSPHSTSTSRLSINPLIADLASLRQISPSPQVSFNRRFCHSGAGFSRLSPAIGGVNFLPAPGPARW